MAKIWYSTKREQRIDKARRQHWNTLPLLRVKGVVPSIPVDVRFWFDFDTVAAFVRQRFPRAKRIADIGGNDGQLAVRIAYGRDVRVDLVDPLAPVLPWDRAMFRAVGVRVLRERFQARWASRYDLLVTTRSHEATPVAIRAAKHGVPLVIVPCSDCKFQHRAPYVKNELLRRGLKVHEGRFRNWYPYQILWTEP